MDEPRSQIRSDPDGPPRIDVVAGVVRDENARVLITQRPEGGDLALFWEFPGGKIEPGEDPPAALRRELREELGIEVEPGRILFETEHADPKRVVRLFFLEAEIAAGEPRAVDVAAFRWVDPADLGAFEFPPADDEFISRLRRAASH